MSYDSGQDEERAGDSNRSMLVAGTGLSYITMKAGPRSVDSNPRRVNVVSYGDKMFGLLGESYIGGGQWSLQTESQSVNLVRVLEVNVTEGGRSETSSASVRTKVSVATSAYNADTEYSGVGGLYHKTFSWSSVSTVSGLSTVVADYVMGTPAPWADVNPQAFSVSQAKVEVTQLVETLNMVDKVHISSMHVWHRIWQNVMRARLSIQIVGGVAAQCRWLARPQNPETIAGGTTVGYVSKSRGINCLRHWASSVAAGNHLLVEIMKDQLHLVPYINYLLGAGCGTFSYDNFGVQAGAARVPHIAKRNPVPLTYSYFITDGEEGGGFTVVDLGLANLPAAGGAGFAAQVVDNWSWEMMGAAVRVLAGAAPMRSDMEAAWMLAVIDCFAEPYMGVQNGAAIGSDQKYTAYSALMSVGVRSVPKGNLACCMLTRMTCGHNDILEARDTAAKLFALADDINTARVCIEPLIYALQLSMRQCGATVPIVLPNADFAQLHIAGVPAPIPNNSDRSGLNMQLCGIGTTEGPSVCMAMLDMMTVKLYDCAVAGPFLMLRIGNDGAAALCPLVGNVNMGECFTSVHPAQLPVGMMGKEALGLAGVQYHLGEQFAEMQIARTPYGFYVRGVPGTAVNDRNGLPEFEGESGVAMLGHTITLRRASGIDSNDCKIMMSAISSSGRREVVAGTVIAHARPACYAFAPPNSFALNSMREPMARLDLFADFDWLTSNDLTLLLPKTQGGANFAASHGGRVRKPAYVWADY